MTLATWFPHRVCLNLDRRPERWAQAQEQFHRHGLDPVQRFAALDGQTLNLPAHWQRTPGAYGCLQSHLAVVREAKAQGYPHLLILEDDVVFAEDLAARLAPLLAVLPGDWDMLSLGGYHGLAPEPVADGLARMRRTYSTHAYVLRASLYDAFIACNSRSTVPVDDTNTELQRSFNCYCAFPHLAWQRDGWSDVQQDEESHWAIRESLVAVGDAVEALLAATQLVLAYRPNGPRAFANLEHLLHFYHANFPSMGILVVADPSVLAAQRLPDFCRFLGLAAADRAHMFQQGYRACADGQTFIFSDHCVRPSLPRFVVPNLQMCVGQGGATFFQTLIPLNEADTEAVHRDQKKSVRFEAYGPGQVVAPQDGAFMLSRSRLERMGDDAWAALQVGTLFPSPNRGLALAE